MHSLLLFGHALDFLAWRLAARGSQRPGCCARPEFPTFFFFISSFILAPFFATRAALGRDRGGDGLESGVAAAPSVRPSVRPSVPKACCIGAPSHCFCTTTFPRQGLLAPLFFFLALSRPGKQAPNRRTSATGASPSSTCSSIPHPHPSHLRFSLFFSFLSSSSSSTSVAPSQQTILCTPPHQTSPSAHHVRPTPPTAFWASCIFHIGRLPSLAFLHTHWKKTIASYRPPAPHTRSPRLPHYIASTKVSLLSVVTHCSTHPRIASSASTYLSWSDSTHMADSAAQVKTGTARHADAIASNLLRGRLEPMPNLDTLRCDAERLRAGQAVWVSHSDAIDDFFASPPDFLVVFTIFFFLAARLRRCRS